MTKRSKFENLLVETRKARENIAKTADARPHNGKAHYDAMQEYRYKLIETILYAKTWGIEIVEDMQEPAPL